MPDAWSMQHPALYTLLWVVLILARLRPALGPPVPSLHQQVAGPVRVTRRASSAIPVPPSRPGRSRSTTTECATPGCRPSAADGCAAIGARHGQAGTCFAAVLHHVRRGDRVLTVRTDPALRSARDLLGARHLRGRRRQDPALGRRFSRRFTRLAARPVRAFRAGSAGDSSAAGRRRRSGWPRPSVLEVPSSSAEPSAVTSTVRSRPYSPWKCGTGSPASPPSQRDLPQRLAAQAGHPQRALPEGQPRGRVVLRAPDGRRVDELVVDHRSPRPRASRSCCRARSG